MHEKDQGCYMCQINTAVMKKQIGCVTVHGNCYIFLHINTGALTNMRKEMGKKIAYNCYIESGVRN